MKSIIERRDRIRSAVESAANMPNKQTYPIRDWRGERLVLDVIRIDSEYLMYRIENSRTKRQQIKYLQDHAELDKNFFNDPEEPKVQKAQEAILEKLLGDDFIEDLSDRGQEEPAIITYEGYIVNGNRRTSALRKIGEEHIQCVVLPKDATKKEIFALEQELQISREFKEPYHWVNELLNIYNGITDPDLHFNEEVMASRLRIKQKVLQAKLRTFDLVDYFLDWRGFRGNYGYEKLDQAEEAFRVLERKLRNKDEDRKTEELRNAVFILVEEPPTQGRLYTHVRKLTTNWDAVYGKICEETGLVGPLELTDSVYTPETDPQNILERITNQVPNDEAPRIFSDPVNAEDLSGKLLEITADVVALSKEISEAESVYDAVSSALRELQSLLVTEDSTRLESTNNKLDEIISVSKRLKQQIENVVK